MICSLRPGKISLCGLAAMRFILSRNAGQHHAACRAQEAGSGVSLGAGNTLPSHLLLWSAADHADLQLSDAGAVWWCGVELLFAQLRAHPWVGGYKIRTVRSCLFVDLPALASACGPDCLDSFVNQLSSGFLDQPHAASEAIILHFLGDPTLLCQSDRPAFCLGLDP